MVHSAYKSNTFSLFTHASSPLADTEPPSIQCPEDISQTILTGQQCTEVTWQIPSVSDNSGQDVTVTSVPPSGTCFSDMASVVTVTASDPSNNMNTCTFVVIIDQISKLIIILWALTYFKTNWMA